MPIDAVVESLDNVPEGLRELYGPGTEDYEGKFVLQVSGTGGLSLANVSKLQSALQSERSTRKKHEDALKRYALEDGNFLDPEEAQAAMARVMELEEAGGEDIEKLKKQLADKSEREIQSLRDKLANDIAAKDTDIDRLKQHLHKEMIVNKAISAISAAKGKVALALPHVVGNLRLEEDGENLRVVVLDKEGNPRLSKQPGNSKEMSIEEFIGELKSDEEYGILFEGSGASGGGARGTAGGGKGGTSGVENITDPVARLKAARAAQGAT